MEQLRLTIQYGELKHEVEGSPDALIQEAVKFISSVIPAYTVASKITYLPDYLQIADEISSLVKIGTNGEILLESSDLAAEEALGLVLLAADIGCRVAKRESNELSVEEMEKATGRPVKTVRNSLVEMIRKAHVERTGRGSYRITLAGTKKLHDAVRQQNQGPGGVPET